MTQTWPSLVFALAACPLCLSCARSTFNVVKTADDEPQSRSVLHEGSSSQHAQLAQPTVSNGRPGEIFDGDGFTLVLPESVRIEKEPPSPDFNIYRFIYQGEAIMFAYVGNHPNAMLDGRAVSSERSEGTVNGLSYQRVRVQNMDGTRRTEVFVRFSDGRFWPVFVHFWYAGLPPDVRQVTEAVIASIKAQENGAFPHPDWARTDPPKWFRWRIAYAERQLKHLREANDANISPLYDPNGRVVPLEARIRKQEQHIRELREQLREASESEIETGLKN